MGEARVLMDRITAGMTNKDLSAVRNCYAPNAVAVTPDEGELVGRDAIVEWFQQFIDAFPDFDFKYLAQHDSGNVAIDEGHVIATNTGTLTLPTGETLPATGRSVRLRACDVAVAENGLVVQHRFYYDQMEFLEQLGLLPEEA